MFFFSFDLITFSLSFSEVRETEHCKFTNGKLFVTSCVDVQITRSEFTLEEICMNRVTDFLLGVSANSESRDSFALFSDETVLLLRPIGLISLWQFTKTTSSC